ncbi:hypothetical protein [Streptomyces sp. NPDC046805]|uniref:Rv1733c family protein n=1 Tax=Streptomyces sp. NPDC046805 TaxID=3155134 RepID=UPI0033EBAB97
MPLRAFRGPKVWLWRWRRNPLKRRDDALEAWVVLGAWLLTVVAGVLAGLTAARSVEQGLARERLTWRPVVARVAQKVPGSAAPDSIAPRGERVWAEVRWTVADGSSRTGQVRIAPGSRAGTPVTVWTDPRGRLVSRPATASEARLHSGLVGALVGVCAAAVPLVTGCALRERLEHRRMDAWDAEWARLGAQGGRTAG